MLSGPFLEMLVFTLLKISVLLVICAQQRVAGELDLTKHGRIDQNQEGFAKLCAIEDEAKSDYEAHIGTVEEEEYRTDYLAIMGIRGTLGATLGILICPSTDSTSMDRYKRLRMSFNRKCRREAKSEAICIAIRIARQTSRVQLKSMVAREQSLCARYRHFKRAREQFGLRHRLLFCDQGVVVPAKIKGREEAQELLSKWNSERERGGELNWRCWDRFSRALKRCI